MQPSTTTLDLEVAQRLDLLCRWTGAIRHDLGNLLYPSHKLMAGAAEEGRRAGELVERVGGLVEMVDACRSALDPIGRLSGGDASGAVIAGEWWQQTKHLFRASAGRATRVEGPTEGDLALPVSARGLTMLTLSVLLAIGVQAGEPADGQTDEQADEPAADPGAGALGHGACELVTIAARRDPMLLAISASAPATGGAPLEIRLPAMTRQYASRLGCQLRTEHAPGRWLVEAAWEGDAG